MEIMQTGSSIDRADLAYDKMIKGLSLAGPGTDCQSM